MPKIATVNLLIVMFAFLGIFIWFTPAPTLLKSMITFLSCIGIGAGIGVLTYDE